MDEFNHILDQIEVVGESVPQPLAVSDFVTLYQLLRKWRVRFKSKWGKGKAKTIGTLEDQLIRDNEARLYETILHRRVRGIVYRRVLTIRLAYDVPPGTVEYDTSPYVYDQGVVTHTPQHLVAPRPLEGRLLLMEYSQEYGMGSINEAKHPNNVSETLGFHEDCFTAAATRAWLEEFGFAPSSREIETLLLWKDLAEGIKAGTYDPGIPLLPEYVRDLSGDSTKYPDLLSIKDIAPHLMFMLDHFDPNGYIEVKPEKTTIFKWVPISLKTPAPKP